MENKIPDISNQIYFEDTLNLLQDNYSILGPHWAANQMEWINGIYSSFKDNDKFLIVIYLIKKTLDFYSRNFIKFTFEEFYAKNTIEIEKFNINEISEQLNIPKESARRKVVELESSLIIKRIKRKIIIDRSAFSFAKPTKSIARISRFLALFSKILKENKKIPNLISSEQLEKVIKNNYSYVWKIYYEFQIPMVQEYKKVFGDIETFHIWGTCVVNQHILAQKKNKRKLSRVEFIQSIYSHKGIQGLNAMSISDITGIPRATVVRKLKKLLKKNFLKIDDKKHYRLTGNIIRELIPMQNIVLERLANFSTKVYNLVIL
tara:strand:- start:713 stop:1669 length:957 start_codon:yes stop_codon:yes gene_type:complete